MGRRPHVSTRAYTLFPYPPPFLAQGGGFRRADAGAGQPVAHRHGADRRAGFAVGRAAVLGDARSGSGGRLPGGTRGGGERAAVRTAAVSRGGGGRSEEHTSELQSLMRISYAVFCLNNTKKHKKH